MLQTTSEKAIRKDLQKHFKTDISDKKQLVKEHVSCSAEHANSMQGSCMNGASQQRDIVDLTAASLNG
jgi:hypothetical protein